MAYARFIDDSCKLCKEMLFAKLLKTDTTGLSIFEARKSWFDENQIHLETWYPAQRMVLHPCLVSRMTLLLILYKGIMSFNTCSSLCGTSASFSN